MLCMCVRLGLDGDKIISMGESVYQQINLLLGAINLSECSSVFS